MHNALFWQLHLTVFIKTHVDTELFLCNILWSSSVWYVNIYKIYPFLLLSVKYIQYLLVIFNLDKYGIFLNIYVWFVLYMNIYCTLMSLEKNFLFIFFFLARERKYMVSKKSPYIIYLCFEKSYNNSGFKDLFFELLFSVWISLCKFVVTSLTFLEVYIFY